LHPCNNEACRCPLGPLPLFSKSLRLCRQTTVFPPCKSFILYARCSPIPASVRSNAARRPLSAYFLFSFCFGDWLLRRSPSVSDDFQPCSGKFRATELQMVSRPNLFLSYLYFFPRGFVSPPRDVTRSYWPLKP